MIYRIWFSDGNDRDELGRVNAPDIDTATEYALKQYFKPDLEYTEEGDNECLYLRIDSCKYCDHNSTNPPVNLNTCHLSGECEDCEYLQCEENSEYENICDYCEVSEYIEICLDNESESEYKTIFGVNEYADLESDIRPTPYNPTLVKAWNMGPQIGVTELMHQTINNNPKLCESVDFEYLKKINKNHEEAMKNE